MRPILSSLVLSLCGLFIVIVVVPLAQAQVPAQMAYQGLLTTPQGEAISDGTYTVTFRLYTDAAAEALFTETQTVAVEGGLFSTLIGKEAGLDLPFDQAYHLTVEVEGQAESEPVPLLASPYALTARRVADGAVVRSISGLKDDIEIVAGDGIAIAQQDNRLVISALSAPVGLRDLGERGASTLPSALKGPGGSNTGLDAAYDAGPIITADAGSVEIQGAGPAVALRVLGGDLLFEDVTGGAPNVRFKTSGGGVTTQEWRWILLGTSGDLVFRDQTAGTKPLVITPGSVNALLKLTGSEVQVKGALSRVDGKALEVKVGGARVMRYEPETSTEGPNVIGGWSGNSVGAGVVGATIAGGGDPDNGGVKPNAVQADYATVGGGSGNTASLDYATVGGGQANTASLFATVGGGGSNTASAIATVGGGQQNTASGQSATVGGGEDNTASGWWATVGGGSGNTASLDYATVGGGQNNTISAGHATLGGGFTNTVSGEVATVGGGWGNTAGGYAAAVPGGLLNLAGGTYSFAAGNRAKVRDGDLASPYYSGDANGDEGTFLWADATAADFVSTGPNQFFVRASGGTTFFSDAALTMGVSLAAGGGSWTSVSDSTRKEGFLLADGERFLAAIGQMRLGSWNYRGQEAAHFRHYGPMAQDFHAAFGQDGIGVIGTDTTLSTGDVDGVLFIAVQALAARTAALDAALTTIDGQQAEIEALRANDEQYQARIAALEAEQAQGAALAQRLAALEALVQGAATETSPATAREE